MAQAFNLTAQLNLQAPGNTKQVLNQIRRQLKPIGIQVNVQNARNLAQANRQLQSFNKHAQSSTKSMGELNRTLQESARRFSVITIATGSFLALANAFKNATKDAIAFERELVKISQVTGKSVSQLSGLSSEVTKLSTSLGTSSADLLNVARTLTQAGFAADKTKKALEVLAQTSLGATFDNIQDTTEGAIALLRQFSNEARSAGGDIVFLEKSLSAISAVSKKFAVESGDLITAIRRTGGVFSAAGGSINELIALFTSVRATTRESAETIATGLRTIFTRIQRPETIDQLRQFGIQLQDAQGNFVGAFEAFKRLSQGLKSLDARSTAFSQIVEDLGGFRQVGKVIPLIQQFTTAQQALTAAQNASGTVAKDAETAQQALGVQIQKTREQFDALIRKFVDSSAFRSLAQGGIELANAFIRIADSLEPLLPMLISLAGLKLGKSMAPMVAGIAGIGRSSVGRGPVTKFARGGMVPGTGNRDTVPAMLTPGEFVIRKSSVKSLGADTLAAMNQNRLKRGSTRAVSKKDVKTETASGFKKLTPTLDTEFAHLDKLNTSGSARAFAAKEKNRKIRQLYSSVGVDLPKNWNRDWNLKNKSGTTGAILKSYIKAQGGNIFKSLLSKGSAYRLTGGKASPAFQELDRNKVTIAQSFANNIKTRRNLDTDADVIKADVGEALMKAFGGKRSLLARATRRVSAVRFEDDEGKAMSRQRASRELSAAAGPYSKMERRAKGGGIGGSDTVPALLTPGEFVFNKSAAQSIGYSNLNRMNKQGVQGFAKGGPVGFQKFEFGGKASTVPMGTNLGALDDLVRQAEAAAQGLEEVEKSSTELSDSTDKQKKGFKDLAAKSVNVASKINQVAGSAQQFVFLGATVTALTSQFTNLEETTKVAINRTSASFAAIVGIAGTLADVFTSLVIVAGRKIASDEAEMVANKAAAASEITETTANKAAALSEARETAANTAAAASEAAESAANAASASTEGAESVGNAASGLAAAFNPVTLIIGVVAVALTGLYLAFTFAKEKTRAEFEALSRSAAELTQKFLESGENIGAVQGSIRKLAEAGQQAQIQRLRTRAADVGRSTTGSRGVLTDAQARQIASLTAQINTLKEQGIRPFLDRIIAVTESFAKIKQVVDDQAAAYDKLTSGVLTADEANEQRIGLLQSSEFGDRRSSAEVAERAMEQIQRRFGNSGLPGDVGAFIDDPNKLPEQDLIKYGASLRLVQITTQELAEIQKGAARDIQESAKVLNFELDQVAGSADVDDLNKGTSGVSKAFQQLRTSIQAEAEARIARLRVDQKLSAEPEQKKAIEAEIKSIQESTVKRINAEEEYINGVLEAKDKRLAAEQEAAAAQVAYAQQIRELNSQMASFQARGSDAAQRTREANRMSALLSGRSVGARQATRLTQDVSGDVDVARLESELKAILNEAITTGATDDQLDSLRKSGDELLKTANAMSQGFDQLVGQGQGLDRNTATTILQDILPDSIDPKVFEGILESIMKAAGDGVITSDEFNSALKDATEFTKKYAEIQGAAADSNQSVYEEQNAAIERNRKAIDDEIQARNNVLATFDKVSATNEQLFDSLQRSAGAIDEFAFTAFKNASRAARAQAAQQVAGQNLAQSGLNANLVGDVGALQAARKAAQDAIEANKGNAQATENASRQIQAVDAELSRLANQGVADLQASIDDNISLIEKERAARQQMLGVLEEFVVGGKEARKNLVEASRGVDLAIRTGTIQNQSEEQRRNTVSLLDKLSDVAITFDRNTGQALTGRDVKQRIVFQDAIRMGLDPAIAQQIATATSTEEKLIQANQQLAIQIGLLNATMLMAAQAIQQNAVVPPLPPAVVPPLPPADVPPDFGGPSTKGGMFASGGLVQYRAGGGSIFKPKGTDTVPAMLAPGEFVIRKSAVDSIGVGTLQALNNGGGPVYLHKGGGPHKHPHAQYKRGNYVGDDLEAIGQGAIDKVSAVGGAIGSVGSAVAGIYKADPIADLINENITGTAIGEKGENNLLNAIVDPLNNFANKEMGSSLLGSMRGKRAADIGIAMAEELPDLNALTEGTVFDIRKLGNNRIEDFDFIDDAIDGIASVTAGDQRGIRLFQEQMKAFQEQRNRSREGSAQAIAHSGLGSSAYANAALRPENSIVSDLSDEELLRLGQPFKSITRDKNISTADSSGGSITRFLGEGLLEKGVGTDTIFNKALNYLPYGGAGNAALRKANESVFAAGKAKEYDDQLFESIQSSPLFVDAANERTRRLAQKDIDKQKFITAQNEKQRELAGETLMSLTDRKGNVLGKAVDAGGKLDFSQVSQQQLMAMAAGFDPLDIYNPNSGLNQEGKYQGKSLADDLLGNLQFSAMAELDKRRRSQDEEKRRRIYSETLKIRGKAAADEYAKKVGLTVGEVDVQTQTVNPGTDEFPIGSFASVGSLLFQRTKADADMTPPRQADVPTPEPAASSDPKRYLPDSDPALVALRKKQAEVQTEEITSTNLDASMAAKKVGFLDDIDDTQVSTAIQRGGAAARMRERLTGRKTFTDPSRPAGSRTYTSEATKPTTSAARQKQRVARQRKEFAVAQAKRDSEFDVDAFRRARGMRSRGRNPDGSRMGPQGQAIGGPLGPQAPLDPNQQLQMQMMQMMQMQQMQMMQGKQSTDFPTVYQGSGRQRSRLGSGFLGGLSGRGRGNNMVPFGYIPGSPFNSRLGGGIYNIPKMDKRLLFGNNARFFSQGGGVDTVPAMLTPGEFIMSKDAVSKYGTGFMRSLNRGQVQGYNKGGLVQYRQNGGGIMDMLGGAAQSLGIDTSKIEGVFDGFVDNFSSSFDNITSSFTNITTGLQNVAQIFSQGFNMQHKVDVGGQINIAGINVEAIKDELSGFIGQYVADEVSKKMDEQNNKFNAG